MENINTITSRRIDEIEAIYPKWLVRLDLPDVPVSRVRYYNLWIEDVQMDDVMSSGMKLRLILKLRILKDLVNDDCKEVILEALSA